MVSFTIKTVSLPLLLGTLAFSLAPRALAQANEHGMEMAAEHGPDRDLPDAAADHATDAGDHVNDASDHAADASDHAAPEVADASDRSDQPAGTVEHADAGDHVLPETSAAADHSPVHEDAAVLESKTTVTFAADETPSSAPDGVVQASAAATSTQDARQRRQAIIEDAGQLSYPDHACRPNAAALEASCR